MPEMLDECQSSEFRCLISDFRPLTPDLPEKPVNSNDMPRWKNKQHSNSQQFYEVFVYPEVTAFTRKQVFRC